MDNSREITDISEYRLKRQRAGSAKWILVLVFLIACTFAGYFFARSSFFAVQRIDVIGNENVPADRLRDLLVVERCDALAHSPYGRDPALVNVDKWEALLTTVLAEKPCLSLKSLAISGDDLLSLGMAPGPRMGQLLNYILEQVADGDLPNDRTALLAYAKKHI